MLGCFDVCLVRFWVIFVFLFLRCYFSMLSLVLSYMCLV